MKIKLLSVITMLLSILSFAQEENLDELKTNFVSVGIGVNTTQINSSEGAFNDPSFDIGYDLGLHLHLFPDEYTFSNYFTRISVEFTAEKSAAQKPDLHRNRLVLSEGDLKLLGLQIFGAYRFNPKAKFNTYLGGGFFFQTTINNSDEAFTFVDEDGEVFPIYGSDSSTPAIFRVGAPTSVLGISAEFGGFFLAGSKRANVGLGLRYGFFLSRNSEALSLDKTSFYLKGAYELF